MPRSKLGHLTVVPRDDDQVREFTDSLWQRLRREADEAYERAPMLAPLFLDSVINQPTFESAVFHRVGARLKNDVISLPLIIRAFQQALEAEPDISLALRADITAVSPTTRPVAWSRNRPRPSCAAGWMSVWNTSEERLCR